MTEKMDLSEQLGYLLKGTVDCIPAGDLERKLKRASETGVPLRVKAGFDPTAPDLHLGHTVLIRKMRHFQQLGHTVIFLIGDFTGMIGDPSGRSATRPQLTQEQLDANAETFKVQIFKLLDPEKTELRFNSEWMSGFKSQDFIRLAAKATVAQLMERDEFKKRFESQTPISVHELLYPLVQGYDSVALKCDIEMGGTDQKFNLLMARQIQREYGFADPQLIVTTPLLEGTDGVQKMSKSLGNYIGITESPKEMFGKIMSISDDLMWRYYEVLTDLPPARISELKESAQNPRDLKAELGRQIVRDFHSQDAALEASDEFDRMFRERQAPSDIPLIEVQAGDGLKLIKLIAQAGLAPSVSEAQRLVDQGSVRIDSERIQDHKYQFPHKPGAEVLVQVGKRKYLRVRFK
ncbi:MAG TPA: tyrosine--tRNA ligase [Blastocatellia bacterium]|nr:tyrosine--tRNA ligase [Blastocatellia bacterium]